MWYRSHNLLQEEEEEEEEPEEEEDAGMSQCVLPYAKQNGDIVLYK